MAAANESSSAVVPMPTAGVAGAHTAEAQRFNSWVIGGGYSKAQMKRNQIRTDLAVQKRQAHKMSPQQEDRLAQRKAEMRDLSSKEVLPYRPKKAEALREERKRQAEEVYATRRAGSPPRTSDGDRVKDAVQRFREEHPTEDPDVALELRARLLQSFQAPTTTQSYGTLFPPLLLPYTRPLTFMRGRDRPKSPVQKESAPVFNTSHAKGATAGSDAARPHEPFGLPQGGERSRPLPQSGPKPFMPTGSSTTAYRHFTNYGLLARMNAANADGLGMAGSAAAVGMPPANQHRQGAVE